MNMALSFKPPPCLHGHLNPLSLCSSSVILSFPFHPTTSLNSRVYALKTGSDGSDLLRKPIVPIGKELDAISEDGEENDGKRNDKYKEDEEWVDWEEQILEDTVPLVGFVRMILHSGLDILPLLQTFYRLPTQSVAVMVIVCKLKRYANGDRLSEEHERTIVERLLPYHPECKKKIGCGIDYITVGHHPDFETSRCLFIVRKDGQLVDFSYWKCIKGLIRKNYPLYADSFILRHFRRRRPS